MADPEYPDAEHDMVSILDAFLDDDDIQAEVAEAWEGSGVIWVECTLKAIVNEQMTTIFVELIKFTKSAGSEELLCPSDVMDLQSNLDYDSYGNHFEDGQNWTFKKKPAPTLPMPSHWQDVYPDGICPFGTQVKESPSIFKKKTFAEEYPLP